MSLTSKEQQRLDDRQVHELSRQLDTLIASYTRRFPTGQ